jgi:hypothetical protein
VLLASFAPKLLIHLPAADMLVGQHPYVANDENWGFADQEFAEQVL